jgi:serine/threonine protein kinase
MASPVTVAGTVVGTMQYMSPEQIQGKEADARLARQAGGQGLALQVLHHQKVDAVLAANVIEDTDVGVLQA